MSYRDGKKVLVEGNLYLNLDERWDFKVFGDFYHQEYEYRTLIWAQNLRMQQESHHIELPVESCVVFAKAIYTYISFEKFYQSVTFYMSGVPKDIYCYSLENSFFLDCAETFFLHILDP